MQGYKGSVSYLTSIQDNSEYLYQFQSCLWDKQHKVHLFFLPNLLCLTLVQLLMLKALLNKPLAHGLSAKYLFDTD